MLSVCGCVSLPVILSLALLGLALSSPGFLVSAQLPTGAVLSVPLNSSAVPRWLNYGGDEVNSHSQTLSFATVADTATRWTEYVNAPSTGVAAVRPSELVITPLTVPSLSVKWTVNLTAPIVCSPSVASDGSLYIPEWGGRQRVLKLNGTTGEVLWKFDVGALLGPNSTDGVRSTPALSFAEDIIVVGSQTVGFAYMFAIWTGNGSLAWITQVDTHPAAFITASPAIDPTGQVVIASVSSDEESSVTSIKGYVCCTFRGSVAGLSLYTGEILWQFYMIPENQTGVGLYSGAAVWGSSTPFDEGGFLVATGNLYDAPNATQQCVNDTLGTPAENACVPEDIYFEAVLKINVSNGALLWSFRADPYDAWTTLCGLNQAFGGKATPPTPFCPLLPYEDDLDRDFGQDPVLFGDRCTALGRRAASSMSAIVTQASRSTIGRSARRV